MTYEEFLGWVVAAEDAANPKRQLKELVKAARRELVDNRARNDAGKEIRQRMMCAMGCLELMRGWVLHTQGRHEQAKHSIDTLAINFFAGSNR